VAELSRRTPSACSRAALGTPGRPMMFSGGSIPFASEPISPSSTGPGTKIPEAPASA